MKKKFLSVLSLLLVLVLQFQSFLPLAKAAEITNADIVKATLTLTDGSGNDLTGQTNVPKNGTVRMNFHFEIPDKDQVNAGDTYTIVIPPQIMITDTLAATPIALDTADGHNIANAVINKASRTVTLTFTQYAHDNSAVTGDFFIETKFDQSQIGNANPVQIPFQIGSQTQPVTINFQQPDPTMAKQASTVDAEGAVTWRVTVNGNKTNISGYSLNDDILAGQDYVPGSLQITDSASQPLPNVSDAACYAAANAGDTTKTGTLSYTFAADSTDTYTVQYKTKLTAQSTNDNLTKAVIVNDTAQLSKEGKTTVSANASQTYPKANLITKSGVQDPTNASRIKWTVTVNADKKQLTNATVSDVISSITPAMTWDGGFTVTDGGGTPVSAAEYVNNSTESTKLELFWASLSDKRIITFYTTISAPNYFNSNQNQSFTNNATLNTTIGGTPVGPVPAPSGNVPISSDVIGKSGVYSPSDQMIKWTVTVNKNKISLPNAKVTDIINNLPGSKDYQQFVADGTHPVQIKQGTGSFADVSAGENDSTAGTYYYDDTTKTFSYYFGSAPITDTYTITFYTKALNPNVTAVDDLTYKIKNSATLTGTGVNQTYDGNAPVSSEVIKKTGVSYDYITRELSWKIVVNKNQMNLSGAVVTDTIPAGQDYKDGSFSIINNKTSTAVAGAVPSYVRNTENDEKSGGTLIYTFSGPIAEQYTITFKTKVSDISVFNSNGTKVFRNDASLKTNLVTEVKSPQATISVGNTVVGKNASYTGGNDFIDWTVQINSNALPLDTGVLVDNLAAGLDLDITSVKLFPQTVSSAGVLTKGAEIPLDASNVSYDRSSTPYVFTLKLDGSTNNLLASGSPYHASAFLLTFTTRITNKNLSSVSNSVSFSGTGIQLGQQGSSTVNGIWVSGGGGSGTGTTGSLTVTKVDSKNSTKKLAGAQFRLYDARFNVSVTEQPVASSADGTALFDKLRFGDYVLKEVTPPTGYSIPAESPTSYPITIDGASNKNITQTIQNEQILVPIQVTKTNEKGEVLPGAEFTLYSGSTVIQTATTGENGIATFSNVPFGNYTVKETKAPDGYLLNPTEKAVAVDNSTYQNEEALSVSFADEKAGTVTVTKKDADTLKTLPGAVFRLLDENKQPVSNPRVQNPAFATGADGIAVFSNLPYGTYYVEEITAPVNYENGALSDPIVVDGTSTELAVTITNKQMLGTVQVTKADPSEHPLAGAEFTLYDSDSKAVAAVVTGTDGIAAFTKVPVGSYNIRETKAPAGYLLNPEALPVEITQENYTEVQKLAMIDQKAGIITVTKIDADNPSHKLAGAVFRLTDKNGVPVGSPVTTDENGTAVFSGLAYETYTVAEVSAPTGYLLGSMPYQAVVSADSTDISAVIPNKKFFGTVQVLKVNRKDRPLAGAEFTLSDARGNTVQSAVSGTDGIAKFENVREGDYTVKETVAPKNFQLDKKAYSVSVTKENFQTVQQVTVVDIPLEGIDDDGLPLINPEDGGPGNGSGSPKTGDSFPVLPVALGAAAAAGLILTAILRTRRKPAAYSKNLKK